MGVTGYKSYTEWTTYEFNDYLPEEYTITNYVMTERKKDGKLLLAGSIIITSENYGTLNFKNFYNKPFRLKKYLNNE